MKIEKISKEILDFCNSEEIVYKENKTKLVKLFQDLRGTNIEIEREMEIFISLHRELSKIKNRKASYLEREIARLKLVDLPFSIRMNDEDIPEGIIETLREDNNDNERLGIKLSGILLKYGKEIIKGKEDKSKRYKNRIKEAIKLLNELQHFYKIEGIKEIFKSRMHDKDTDLQFFALYGLEIYHAHEDAEELTKEEEKELEEIIKTTTTRETASTCCQILINADKIDEFGALMRIDNWKDRNWR